MSVNRVNESTGELVTLSSGVRCWIGTKAAHTIAVVNHTIPNNVMVCITDDYSQDGFMDNSKFTYNPIVVGDDYTPPDMEYLRVARQGNIVIVAFSHMTFTLANTITEDALLLSGLPTPKGNSFGNILFIDNNASTLAYVRYDSTKTTGEIMLSPGHPDSIIAGNKQLYGTIVYYTED